MDNIDGDVVRQVSFIFKGRFNAILCCIALEVLQFPLCSVVFIVLFTPKPNFPFEARRESAFLLAKLSSL